MNASQKVYASALKTALAQADVDSPSARAKAAQAALAADGIAEADQPFWNRYFNQTTSQLHWLAGQKAISELETTDGAPPATASTAAKT